VTGWPVAIQLAMAAPEADPVTVDLHIPARLERPQDGATERLATIVLRKHPFPTRSGDVLGDAHCIMHVTVRGGLVEGSPDADCDDSIKEASSVALSQWVADPASVESGGTYSFLMRINFAPNQVVGSVSTNSLTEASPISWFMLKPKRRVKPPYPGGGPVQQVSCTVHYVIDSEGVAQWATVLGCPENYRRSVESVAMSWEFYPHRVDGSTTAVEFDLSIIFQPSSKGGH
jgi:hypothetical protein